MSAQPQSIFWSPRRRLLLTIAVFAIGLAIAGFFGVRSVRSFQQFRYIQQQGLDRGTASVDAIRPWMTIRFIAVAYAVPEEYVYSALAIPFDKRAPDQSLGEINKDLNLGPTANGTGLAIIDQTKAAITEYRANPVETGLRDVRIWMSIRYIANGSGISEDQIFAAIGIPAADNQNKPLGLLSDQQHYPGGPRALEEAVQKVLTPKATP